MLWDFNTKNMGNEVKYFQKISYFIFLTSCFVSSTIFVKWIKQELTEQSKQNETEVSYENQNISLC